MIKRVVEVRDNFLLGLRRRNDHIMAYGLYGRGAVVFDVTNLCYIDTLRNIELQLTIGETVKVTSTPRHENNQTIGTFVWVR